MSSFQPKLQQEYKSETQSQNPAPSMVEWMHDKVAVARSNAILCRREAQRLCDSTGEPSVEDKKLLARIGLGHLVGVTLRRAKQGERYCHVSAPTAIGGVRRVWMLFHSETEAEQFQGADFFPPSTVIWEEAKLGPLLETLPLGVDPDSVVEYSRVKEESVR